jgi:hypothetical protein
MPKPPLNTFTDESITAVIQKLPTLLVELWHERSAIREYCPVIWPRHWH